MKTVKITTGGRERYLAFTGEAMFQIQEQFGGVRGLMEKIGPDTRESFQAVCEAAAILLEQTELARRSLGYDKGDIVSADTLKATTTPGELLILKTALTAAIELGFGRDVKPENDEIDLGLAELNQKKTN